MTAYLVRRLLYAIPIVLGVNVATFVLFFFVNTPDHMARLHLPEKRQTLEQIEAWKRKRNYHLPYFYNDGLTQEWVREVSQDGWLDPPPLPAGECAISFELPEGRGDLVATLAANPPVEPRSPGKPPEGLAMPEGFAFHATRRFPLGDAARTEREEFRVTHEKGSTLKLHVDVPPGAVRVVVRLYRKLDLSFFERFTQTIFFQKSVRFLWFNFGLSDDGRRIGAEIRKRIVPSLSVTVPMFVLSVLSAISFALFLAFFRATYLDFWGVILCVAMMSISILFYVIGGQWLMGTLLRLFPISGFEEGVFDSAKFVMLPILIGTLAGLGVDTRWYRTIFLEEMGKDYVRTARSKGLPETLVLYRHVLKNAMIPILTGIVVALPFLFIGSLILESFFAIPGMGSFTIEAIQRQDFAIVQAMVFLGSVLYIAGLILTDISYTLVDPRVRFE